MKRRFSCLFSQSSIVKPLRTLRPKDPNSQSLLSGICKSAVLGPLKVEFHISFEISILECNLLHRGSYNQRGVHTVHGHGSYTHFPLELCHKCYSSGPHNYMREIYKHRTELDGNPASFIGKRKKLWNRDSREVRELRVPTGMLNKLAAGWRAAGSWKSTQVTRQHVPLWAQCSPLQPHDSPLWCWLHDSVKSLNWLFTIANHLILPLSFELWTHDSITKTALPGSPVRSQLM